MPYPSPMPEYQPLFHQVQNFIADQLNSDPQLSGIGIEFLPESQLDIEYGIKRNLGRQGMVGIVNTLKGQYGGHDQDSCAWEIESEIDVLETPTVRRAWLKQNNLSAGTTVDVLNYIQESLCGPASPTYGKFCPVTQEVGEDNGVVVGKAVVKTFAIADVSACVSGESNWHIRYATEADISALWSAVDELSAELSGSEEVWNAIYELSSDVSSLHDDIQEIDQDLSGKISYPVMGQNPYGSNEWILDPSPLDPDTPSTARVKFGAYEESVPGLYTPYIKLGDNPYLTIDQNHIWLGRTKLVNFPDMSAAISALDIDHVIRWFATPSQPNRWIINFGRSSTGGISFVSDSDNPTQSYIDIAGNLITAPGYDPELSSRGSVEQTTRGLMKARSEEDDHLMFNQKGLAFVEELSAVEADLEPRLSAIEGDVSALSTQIEEVSAWDTTQDDLISELSTQTISNSTDISALSVEIQEVSANMSKSIVRRWEQYVEYNGLTFTAEEANSTIAMQKVGYAPDVSLEYSTGDGWNDFIVGETTVTLPNIGDKMWMRAKTTNSGFATNNINYNKFVMTGSIAASDSIMYLLKSDGDLSAISSQNCFDNLFVSCSSLTKAPELPATTLANWCYQFMFRYCTSLTTPPSSLPATVLPRACYQGLFEGCTSLTATPATLGATTVSGTDVMGGMFAGCVSLTSAFDINVATPSVGAFYGTFYECSSLTSVNVCQMTSAPQNAFREMFYNCTSLTTAPDVFANISYVGQQAFSKTFYGCTSITQIPTLPSATGNGLARFCFEHMFEGCTGLTGTIDLTQFTDIQGTGNLYGAFDYAFVGCTGITKVDLSNLTSAHGIYHEFDGCTSLQELDLSNLETIRSDSAAAFENMCNGCTSLTTVHLNKLASMGSSGNQWHNTFKGCSSLEDVFIDQTQTIPYFYNNDTFTNANADYKIYVPESLYDQWIVTSGWSDIAIVPHIVSVDPVQKLCFTAEQANSTVAMQATGDAPSVSLEYTTDGTTWNDFIVGTTTVTLANVGDKMWMRAKTTNSAMATSRSDTNYFVMTGTIAATGHVNSLLQGTSFVDITIPNFCYHGLFKDCASLVSAPELGSLTIGEQSYRNMFLNCTSLVDVPVNLPATTLASLCYDGMFQGCTSLTTAPTLPATTLANQCYVWMFYGCTSLNSIKIGYTGNFDSRTFESWVYNVPSGGTFYYNGSDTTRGIHAIPNGWTVQTF